jgi:hypothetical protein
MDMDPGFSCQCGLRAGGGDQETRKKGNQEKFLAA